MKRINLRCATKRGKQTELGQWMDSLLKNAMKAKVEIVSVEITCPKCRETIPEPDSGSHFWSKTELPQTVTCPNCGVELSVPQKVKGQL